MSDPYPPRSRNTAHWSDSNTSISGRQAPPPPEPQPEPTEQEEQPGEGQ